MLNLGLWLSEFNIIKKLKNVFSKVIALENDNKKEKTILHLV